MQTLDDLLIALFPDGTAFPEIAGLERADEPPVVDFEEPPHWPPDVFAYAAKLLDMSGAYHHVSPETKKSSLTTIRQIKVSARERDEAVTVGSKWAASLRRRRSRPQIPQPPHKVRELWAALRSAKDARIFTECDLQAPPPAWWRSALILLMIADEAAREVGFDPDTRRGDQDPMSGLDIFLDIFRFVAPTELDRQEFADNLYSCSFANQAVVGVMPKSRTPVVGCTLRSLSHNLALMPPGGEVRVRWMSPHQVDARSDGHPLKMLIVPYPYKVDAECFEPVDVANVDPDVMPWGWFRIVPRWLGSRKPADRLSRAAEFADFIVSLVEEAGRDGAPVNAVLLPEAALDETFFSTLFDALLRRCPEVETLVAGTSEMPVGTKMRHGNFVAQGVFVTSDGKRQGVRTIREKHHRWRLERSQIELYQLGARLNPGTLWWEGIDITSRSLDVIAFRPNATMTTLICEDLARVDPCQGAVRAIGPTLLVALLMDGSQLGFRWPGRYATVLAEDPGCSVLSITSLGLINRSRLADGSKPKWSVALWRDDYNSPTEILLQPGHHAVCITASPVWRTECTLDGRQDEGQALAWQLQTDGPNKPHSVKAAAAPPKWVVDGTA